MLILAPPPPRPHERAARHPQIAQARQREQLRRFLVQTLVANLGKAKLALGDSEGLGLEFESPVSKAHLFYVSNVAVPNLHTAVLRRHYLMQACKISLKIKISIFLDI